MNLLGRLFSRLSRSGPASDLAPVRTAGNRAAIVFVHGFQGGVGSTWELFIRQLEADMELSDWDIFSLGFPSKLSLDLPLWKADPGIVLCARSMATKLRSNLLADYDCVAIVAHSMGGLVAQRAILDTDLLDGRLSHLLLYGTPSAGLIKAGVGKLLKLQLRDMTQSSPFIMALRADWNRQIGTHPSFGFRTIAGVNDAFVPPESSLGPFAERYQEAVPGDHLEIVRPQSINDLSFDVFKQVIRDSAVAHSATETARLAVERKDFRQAIGILEPHFAELDASGIVTLALALESEGKSDRAVEVLDAWHPGSPHLDVLGTLAGRLKRRWLFERRKTDFDRALALYREGYEGAIASGDPEQAYYHAINVAYLLVANSGEGSRVSEEAFEAAKAALAQCALAAPSAWNTATQGEAKLILGNLDGAVADYRAASVAAASLRDRQSMYVQATALVTLIYGEEERVKIDFAFGIIPPG